MSFLSVINQSLQLSITYGNENSNFCTDLPFLDLAFHSITKVYLQNLGAPRIFVPQEPRYLRHQKSEIFVPNKNSKSAVEITSVMDIEPG